MSSKKLYKELFGKKVFIPVIIYFQYIFITLLWILFNSEYEYSLEGVLEILSPVGAIYSLYYYAPYSIMGLLICPLYMFISKYFKSKSFFYSLILYVTIIFGAYVLLILINFILVFFNLMKYIVWPLVTYETKEMELLVILYFLGNFLFSLFFIPFWSKTTRD